MKNKRLTSTQIFVMTVSSILGVDILIVQHNMVGIAGQDAWIPLTLGGLLVFLVAIPLLYLMNTNPDKDLPQIILEVAGKWLGRILLLPIGFFVVVYAGWSTRIFAQALKMFLVDRTPIWVIVISIVVAAIYLVYKGVYTMGAVLDILFPISILSLVILIVLSLPKIEPDRLKPILFRNTNNVIKATIPGFYHFSGYGLVSYFIRYVDDKKAAFKSYVLGLGIPVFFYVTLTLICIMVFGAPPLSIIAYPTLNLSKSVEFEAAILDRLESFMAVFWISMVFASVAIFTFASIRNISVFFSVAPRNRKYLVYAHLIILPLVSLIIPRGVEVFQLYDRAKYIEVIKGFVLIPILALWAKLNKKRGTSG